MSFNTNGCDLFHNAQDVKESEFFFFDADNGHDVFCDGQDRNTVMSVLTPSDKNQLGSSNMSTFESNSFCRWLCDNLATGHVYNDVNLLCGKLVPSKYKVRTATGMSNTVLMGTVILRLTDDEGTEHDFTINKVVYIKDSPVNILSTNSFAELFSDEYGCPDRLGTGYQLSIREVCFALE